MAPSGLVLPPDIPGLDVHLLTPKYTFLQYETCALIAALPPYLSVVENDSDASAQEPSYESQSELQQEPRPSHSHAGTAEFSPQYIEA